MSDQEVEVFLDLLCALCAVTSVLWIIATLYLGLLCVLCVVNSFLCIITTLNFAVPQLVAWSRRWWPLAGRAASTLGASGMDRSAAVRHPQGSRQHSKRRKLEAISQAQAAESLSDAVTSAAIQHVDAGPPSLQTPPLAACGASSQSLSRNPLLDSGYTEADAAATPQQAQASPPTTSWQQTLPAALTGALSLAAAEPGQSSVAAITKQSPPDCNRVAIPGRARRRPTGQSSQAAKKARRQAPAVHRPSWQLVPAEAFTPEELGGSLLALGVLPQRACSYGCQAGQWVADDTIIAILAAVCSEKASSLTHAGHSYELVTCYLNSLDMTVDIPNEDLTTPPEQPQCILVVHTSAQGTGQHFSSLVINPAQQLVHAFDSLGGRWADGRVKAVVQGLYPNLDLFGQHGYRLSNNTGKIRQTGATCGPWALWCLAAYVFNYKQCRHHSSDEVDCAVLKDGALAFWGAVTA